MLFLIIGPEYDRKQISGLYTRFMRDEVLAAQTRRNLLPSRFLPLVRGSDSRQIRLEGVHLSPRASAGSGIKVHLEANPDLKDSRILVHFQCSGADAKVEDWGKLMSYAI